MRGATRHVLREALPDQISTHAPLAGRDWQIKQTMRKRLVFQPTRPLRGATTSSGPLDAHTIFQPTRPLRGATRSAFADEVDVKFQPTRPLRGATAKVYKSLCTFLR